MMTMKICLSVIVASLLAKSAAADKSMEEVMQEHWRDANSCGVNVGYMLLKSQSDSCPTYAALSEELTIGREGTRLPEIRDALGGHGLACRIAKAKPSQLVDIPLPAIAHVERNSAGRFGSSQGHYVLLIDTSDGIRYIDGSTADVHSEDLASFSRDWTGYLLVIDEGASQPTMASASLWLVAGIGIGVGLAIFQHRLRTSISQHSKVEPNMNKGNAVVEGQEL